MNPSGFGKYVLNALVTAIAGRAVEIAKAELADAKLEVETKVKGLSVGLGLLAAAVGAVGVGLVMLIISGTIALSKVWEPWLSTLVVGGSLVVIAIILGSIGAYKVNRNKNLKPERAIANLQRYFGR